MDDEKNAVRLDITWEDTLLRIKYRKSTNTGS